MQKSNCVLCHIPLQDSDERYRKQGNFCGYCSNQCTGLSSIYPYFTIGKDDTERMKQYDINKEYYDKKTQEFQTELIKLRKENDRSIHN